MLVMLVGDEEVLATLTLGTVFKISPKADTSCTNGRLLVVLVLVVLVLE